MHRTPVSHPRDTGVRRIWPSTAEIAPRISRPGGLLGIGIGLLTRGTVDKATVLN